MLQIKMRGSPDEATKSQITNELALKYVNSLPPNQKVPLEFIFPDVPADALDLIDKMLDLNPEKRISVEDALEHPFLASLHEPWDEPVYEGPLDFSFESDKSLTMVKI